MKHPQTSGNLIKRIFDAELPENFIRSIPSQALFLAIKNQGLTSSMDVLDIATIEQCRLFLDFDCWEKDRFSEENLWEWLSLSDEESGLKHLEKLLKFVDFRFVAILISRYVEIITYDDANDSPPGSGFYTPDKGFTWIGLHDLDATRTFYLNRFLALIFDNDAALFYQLCAIPMVSTPSLLEEESYKDRCTRISAEGVPELEYAFELTTPLQPYAIKEQINSHGLKSTVENIPIIEPLLYDTSFVQPLSSLLNSNVNLDELEMELTLILNAAIVRWQIPFFEAETIKHWSEKVKGAINIGLEDVIKTSNLPLIDIYRILGFQKLFRLGLWHLMELQKVALKIPAALIEPETLSAENFSILACAREEIPEIPNFFNKDGSIQSEEGTLVSGTKAIEHLEEIQMLKKRLEDLFNN